MQFESPEYGFRAMPRVLQSHQRQSLTSVREIISIYASASENHTQNYININFVAGRLNASPDTPLNLEFIFVSPIQVIAVLESWP